VTGAVPARPAAGSRGRCLVVHPGALGDVLLALPALAHLGALGFTRVLAAAARLGRLVQDGGGVEEAIDLEGLGLHHLFVAGAECPVPAGLRTFDAVVSWLGAGDPEYVRRLAAASRRAIVDRSRPAPGVRTHVGAHLLATLAPLGPLPAMPPGARLEPTPPARAWARSWLGERGLGAGEVVLLQAGAGSPAKVWPAAPELARRLEADRVPVALVAGPADGPALARFGDTTGVGAGRVLRDLPLDRLAALSSLAGVFVGNDSGPTHLAAAVGCPTLALFGPTDPAIWRPIGARVRVVAGRGPAATSPWEGVDVDRVLGALRALSDARSGTRDGAAGLLGPARLVWEPA
jgi:ADP-heptose:LPS heptosyltransferase